LKNKVLSIAACFGLLLLSAASLLAHHGMAAIFDVDHKVTMKATLTKVDWVNPHIGLEMDAKSEDGKTEHWRMETSPPSWYGKDGFTKADFEAAIGQQINVIFLKALDGSKYGYLERITFPNGSVGYSMNGIKDKDK